MLLLKLQDDSCPIVETIKTLAGKWNLITIRYLLEGPKRFNELKRNIGNINSKTLSVSLKHLMREGLAERRVIETSPISVEYCLTDKGKELTDALQAMAKWGNKWLLDQKLKEQREPVALGLRSAT